jgi:hypothetical protein
MVPFYDYGAIVSAGGRCGVANGLTLDLETGVRNCAWDSRMKKRKK